MATAKTGSFFLTESITIPGGTTTGGRIMGTMDIGAYVNVPTGQAIAIEEVDFVYQTANFSGNAEVMLLNNGTLTVQLTDLNPGSLLVRADDQSLIASGALNIDVSNNLVAHMTDLYPDNFGPVSLSEAFMVVNDTLYFTGGVDGATTAAGDIHITCRVKARVVKLSSKDWMAIAIQSTASDN